MMLLYKINPSQVDSAVSPILLKEMEEWCIKQIPSALAFNKTAPNKGGGGFRINSDDNEISPNTSKHNYADEFSERR